MEGQELEMLELLLDSSLEHLLLEEQDDNSAQDKQELEELEEWELCKELQLEEQYEVKLSDTMLQEELDDWDLSEELLLEELKDGGEVDNIELLLLLLDKELTHEESEGEELDRLCLLED